MSPERFRGIWERPKAFGSVSGTFGSVRERVGASGNAWERLGAVGGVSERPGEPLGGLKTRICTARRGSQRPQAAQERPAEPSARPSGSPERPGEPQEGLKTSMFTSRRGSQRPQAA